MPDQPGYGAALNTDLYELTMAAGFFEAGKAGNRATFELFVRRLPWNRNFVLAVGLAHVVEYLLNLRFTPDEIAFLKSLPQFERTPSEFFDMLAGLRFTGDVFAVREGTPLFAGEPFLTIRAPLIICCARRRSSRAPSWPRDNTFVSAQDVRPLAAPSPSCRTRASASARTAPARSLANPATAQANDRLYSAVHAS